MKKFVFLNPDGIPSYTATPADDSHYQDGIVFNDMLCKEVPFDTSDTEILERWYWKGEEIKVRPLRPGDFYAWSSELETWLPNLDAAREAQRQAWNAWRDRELIAGCLHNGHVFHSDDRFIAELQLILKGYERGYITSTSAIRTRDNVVLQLAHTEIEGLLLLLGLHRQAIYAQSWAGKDALASLTTLESIMAGGPPQ